MEWLIQENEESQGNVRESGDESLEPPTEFWTQDGTQAQDSTSDSSFADVTLSPNPEAPLSSVIAQANRIIEETVEEIALVEQTVTDTMMLMVQPQVTRVK